MRESKTTARMVVATVALLFGISGLALAHGGDDHGEGHGKATTLRGEILDMACYVAEGAKGPDHAGCAKACVKGGQPMGLLADDGTVWLLYASHENAAAFEQAKEHAGKKVEIRGKAAERAGLKGFEVHAVQGL